MIVNKCFLNQLSHFQDKKSDKEDMLSFLVYDISIQKWVDTLYDQLKKLQSIKNSFHRKEANGRIYALIEHLKSEYEPFELVGHICLIHDEINIIKLPKKKIALLKEYQIKNFYFFRDDHYCLDIFTDLLFDHTLKNYVEVSNTNLSLHQGNRHRQKLLETHKISSLKDLEERVQSLPVDSSNRGIIYGKNQWLKKLNVDKWDLILNNLNREELIEKFRIFKLEKNNQLLSKVFEAIEKGDHKLIIGEQEMKTNIRNYMIKEAYCCSDYLDKFIKFAPPDYYNFKVIEIGKLETGDSADIIYKDYGGYIGLKYY